MLLCLFPKKAASKATAKKSGKATAKKGGKRTSKSKRTEEEDETTEEEVQVQSMDQHIQVWLIGILA